MHMIEFKGFVTSGMQKAGMFMKKDTYQKQYKEKLGFIPFNGTLNVKLDEDVKINIKEEFDHKLKTIHGNSTLGDVYFIDATLKRNTKSEKGAILFPTRTTHHFDTLEFVSEKNLRKTMELTDNDEVIIIIQ